jgi:hypothetical protein
VLAARQKSHEELKLEEVRPHTAQHSTAQHSTAQMTPVHHRQHGRCSPGGCGGYAAASISQSAVKPVLGSACCL